MLQPTCGLSTPLEGNLSGSTSWLPQIIHKNNQDHAFCRGLHSSTAITWLCNCIEHKSFRGSKREVAMDLLHSRCALIMEVCCWLVRAQGCHLTSQQIFCQEDEKTRNTQTEGRHYPASFLLLTKRQA